MRSKLKALWKKIRKWEPIYWLRSHLWNRYHIVDCRSPQNDYSWGYCDPCGLILYANFAILVAFVEKEEAFGPDGNWDWGHPEAKQALEELYYWWKTGRAEDHKAVYAMRVPNLKWEPVPNKPYSRMVPLEGQDRIDMDAFGEALDGLDAIDDAQLLKLMAYRHHMWT